MSSPVLSIIIPTRNRYKTAVACVKQVLSCEGDFELIVRDCSDSDDLRETLERFQDERLRYDYSPPVSMTENWEGAISLASGDYIYILGDDDGINPIVPKIAEYMQQLDIQALISPGVLYTWPDLPLREHAGKLIVRQYVGTVKKEEITNRRMEKLVRMGADSYTSLPRLYRCLIARNLVENLQKLTGRIFDSLAPDVYTAFALTSVLKEYYVVDYPLGINGQSKKSNSGRNRTEVKEHFVEYGEYPIPTLIPPLLTVATGSTEAMIKALENTQRQNLIELVPMDKLYAVTIGSNLSYWKIIVSHLNNKVLVDKDLIYKLKIYIGILLYMVKRTITKAVKFLSKLLPKHEEATVYEAHDINEASVILAQHLNDNGMTKKVIEVFEGLKKSYQDSK